jgi:hypothetical protein
MKTAMSLLSYVKHKTPWIEDRPHVVGRSPSGVRRARSRRSRRLLGLLAFAAAMAAFASPAMAAGGAISGKVTNNAATPVPVSGICVEALNPSTGSVVSDVLSGAGGQYTISGLAAGSYKVEFYDCRINDSYVTQYYNNQPSLATAGSVAVTAGGTTSGINAKLVPGAKINGTVTNNAATPKAIANICVMALNGSNASVASARTNSSGQYSLTRLPAGSYKIDFYDCSGAGYLSQFYNNQSLLTNANPVSVTVGATKSGINAKMVLGGKIAGTVTNNAATPAALANICVDVYPAAGGFAITSTYTDASGRYTVIGLPTGSYKVEFQVCTGTGYLTQYYHNQPTLAAANSIAVTDGTTTGGIGAKMVPAGQITGTVTNNAATPKPLAGMCVDVWDASSNTFVNAAKTNSAGQYAVGPLAAGSYKVEFIDCAASLYVNQYYNNKATLATATPITVTGGSTKAGINAKLVPGGKIAGTVTDSSTHQPVPNICVDAVNPSTDALVGGGTTDSNGQYTVSALAAGTYKVEFIDCSKSGYLTEFYLNQGLFANATPVSVTAQATHSGIDQALTQL